MGVGVGVEVCVGVRVTVGVCVAVAVGVGVGDGLVIGGGGGCSMGSGGPGSSTHEEEASAKRTSSAAHADALGRHTDESFPTERASRTRDLVSIDDAEATPSEIANTGVEMDGVRPPPAVKIDTSRPAIINAIVLAEVFQRPDQRWEQRGF